MITKKLFLYFFFMVLMQNCIAQDFQSVDINSEVTNVQPMTGIVFWPGNSRINTDAVALEFSYMSFADVVIGEDDYDWTAVEKVLDNAAGRNHQAILRFRYAYPGRTTTVPQYLKDLPDYNETEGTSEGKTTWFADWTNEELKDMTLKFYSAFAERYDTDPRLAFLQVGFGLWAEYHIYSGPFKLGETFPDKAFQKLFFDHLDEVFENTYFSISIDAASSTYSPFEEEPNYKEIEFGVFDDSFMHRGHAGYNTDSWNFFDRERYQIAPAGGEFSYYSDYDQMNVLNPDVGAHDIPYEIFAQNFHITYMIGNDQGRFHSLDRIKEASMASGYVFKLNSVKTKAGSTEIELVNLGVSPIYVDAYLTVNGIRSDESLKLLRINEPTTFQVASGGDNLNITIESDDILSTEEIQFFGTVNEYSQYEITSNVNDLSEDATENQLFKLYPNIAQNGDVKIEFLTTDNYSIRVMNISGQILKEIDVNRRRSTTFNISSLTAGMYSVLVENSAGRISSEKLIIY